MKFNTPVQQPQPFNRDYFHDNWCPICDFMGFWIFWKKDVVVPTFVKFELSSLNYTQIYYIHQGTLVLNLAKIDWSVQIFSDFEFFEIFFKIVLLRQISIYRAEILWVNALILTRNLARCPPPILMKLKYVKEDSKKWDTCFFLSAEKRFKGVKTTPKFCTQKSFIFLISRKIIIFF